MRTSRHSWSEGRRLRVGRTRQAAWGTALGALCLLAAGACQGYRSDPLFPANARRVAVPIFGNETFFRQIEFDLTRSVAEVLRTRPGVHVTEEEEADVVLEGTITDLDQRVLSIRRRERATEQSATTRVRCKVVNARTGETIKEFTASERVDFAVATGEGLRTAQQEAYYDLARKIVDELEADW